MIPAPPGTHGVLQSSGPRLSALSLAGSKASPSKTGRRLCLGFWFLSGSGGNAGRAGARSGAGGRVGSPRGAPPAIPPAAARGRPCPAERPPWQGLVLRGKSARLGQKPHPRQKNPPLGTALALKPLITILIIIITTIIATKIMLFHGLTLNFGKICNFATMK